MKTIAICVLSFFATQLVSAQNSMVDGAVNITSPSFFLEYLRDDKSADLFKPDIYSGVEGSPYFSPDWMYATIKLADGKQFDSVLLKLNLYEKKIHFKDNTGREKMIAAQVKEVHVRDVASKWNNYTFVSGYGDDPAVFYQAIADGKKAALLKSLKVIIKESKVFNGPNKKEFELQDYFYVVTKGTLYEQSKNCSSLLAAFANDSKITSFVSANDIKCNKEKDLVKLVNYYNSY